MTVLHAEPFNRSSLVVSFGYRMRTADHPPRLDQCIAVLLSQTLSTTVLVSQGRVKRLTVLCGCVLSAKNSAVCCLTARKSPRNSSLPLGLAIYILRKMPRKPDESSVECYGHGFLIAARPRGV